MQLKNINIVQVADNEKMEMSLTEFLNNVKQSNGAYVHLANNDIINAAYKPVPPPKPLSSPPYRMPPQPLGGSGLYHGEISIPGSAQTELQSSAQGLSSTSALRTHSSKFPIERELILSSDKGSSKIPLMHESRTPSGVRRTNGIPLLNRPTGSIAPDHPPHIHAWNSQQLAHNQSADIAQQQSTISGGAIPRTPARLPEDVTALAERDMANKDRDGNKNAVTKTYHTLKDLISGKFKKDTNESTDELNNVIVQQQSISGGARDQDDYRSPYSALPVHMRQMQGLNQSQPNIWNGKSTSLAEQSSPSQNGRPYLPSEAARGVQQQRANSQPQLNMPAFERRGSQTLLDQPDRRGSMANIDVTDSDEGGFASRAAVRRPQTMYQMPHHNAPANQHQHPVHPPSRNSPQYQSSGFGNQQYIPSPYQHTHHNPGQFNGNSGHQMNHQDSPNQLMQQSNGNMNYSSAHVDQQSDQHLNSSQIRQDILRASFQKQQQEAQQNQINQHNSNFIQDLHAQPTPALKINQRTADARHPGGGGVQEISKQLTESAGSSDYDKSGNQSSNVDSGRGSAIYSSGRKIQVDTESSESPMRSTKNDDSEWVDIVDAELRHILEPGMQGLSLRPESTVSGSVSSMSPPLPPLSPDNSSYKPIKTKDTSKQEYGTDSYNRPGRNSGAIGPSRAGWPGASVQKQNHPRATAKKHDQALLKRHLFGLDNDMTSTTTRSLDLESLLGGQWGTGQSVSDSETDTQGIRHIRSQLEGLENMYGEVLKMLGSRAPNGPLRSAAARRRHGSLSSLPSSSVSGRPIRDRRRTNDRRKVRDIKGINKRFQRLESHVVTLARSVAHLSSEMRSQHLVTQELERLRDELTALRSQTTRSQHIYRSTEPEPPNLTNPRRVKKLTKFFGDDPPLMRLFLKGLGYEKYANLFEAERVGMIELPYLGEERLQKLGVPLGPRLRILQEAQISLCKDTTLCIV